MTMLCSKPDIDMCNFLIRYQIVYISYDDSIIQYPNTATFNNRWKASNDNTLCRNLYYIVLNMEEYERVCTLSNDLTTTQFHQTSYINININIDMDSEGNEYLDRLGTPSIITEDIL